MKKVKLLLTILCVGALLPGQIVFSQDLIEIQELEQLKLKAQHEIQKVQQHYEQQVRTMQVTEQYEIQKLENQASYTLDSLNAEVRLILMELENKARKSPLSRTSLHKKRNEVQLEYKRQIDVLTTDYCFKRDEMVAAAQYRIRKLQNNAEYEIQQLQSEYNTLIRAKEAELLAKYD